MHLAASDDACDVERVHDARLGGVHLGDGIDDAVGGSGIAAAGGAGFTVFGAMDLNGEIGTAGDGDGVQALAGVRRGPFRGALVVDTGDVLHHDQGAIVDDALHLEAEGTHAALLEVAHAGDGDRAFQRPLLDDSADLVDRNTQTISDDTNDRTPHHLQREVEQHRRGGFHRPTEADQGTNRVWLVIERIVEDLAAADLGDVGAHSGEEQRQDVTDPTRVDARGKNRRTTVVACRSNRLGKRRWRRGRVIERIEAGRHHVRASPQHRLDLGL
ncbi:MAG: hypothetical protein VX742_00950 [Actinomycetota bacterium]|nr:hypothetical protein [Actinomycetota bacterium]